MGPVWKKRIFSKCGRASNFLRGHQEGANKGLKIVLCKEEREREKEDNQRAGQAEKMTASGGKNNQMLASTNTKLKTRIGKLTKTEGGKKNDKR